MRKAAILIRASTEKENAIMEKTLLDYAEKAQIEVVSGMRGDFSGINSFKIALSNLQQMDIPILLTDSIDYMLEQIGDIGMLHDALKAYGITCYSIQNEITLGAQSHIEMKPHKKRAWLLTNAQADAEQQMKIFANNKDMEIVYIDNRKIDADVDTMADRMRHILKDKTEIILIPDGNVFDENMNNPSLHAMTKIAIKYDIDIIITDSNFNLTDAIRDTNKVFELMANTQKQRAAIICTSMHDSNDDAIMQMNEYAKQHNYISAILIETSQNTVMDQHINDILQEEIDVLIMREGTILTSNQQEKLEKCHIEIQKVEIQSQEQELSSIQQFQA